MTIHLWKRQQSECGFYAIKSVWYETKNISPFGKFVTVVWKHIKVQGNQTGFP